MGPVFGIIAIVALIAAAVASGYWLGRRGYGHFGWPVVLILVLSIYELMSLGNDIGLGFLHSRGAWGSLGDAILALGVLTPISGGLSFGLTWGWVNRPADVTQQHD